MDSIVRERITDALRLLLAAGGPLSALILKYSGMDSNDFNQLVQVILIVVPPVGAWVWGKYANTIDAKVQVIAEQPPAVQVKALEKVPDVVKVQVAEAVPEVATVVVKDNANGALGVLAQSEAHPNIVTETQNERDAKMGTKV